MVNAANPQDGNRRNIKLYGWVQRNVAVVTTSAFATAVMTPTTARLGPGPGFAAARTVASDTSLVISEVQNGSSRTPAAASAARPAAGSNRRGRQSGRGGAGHVAHLAGTGPASSTSRQGSPAEAVKEQPQPHMRGLGPPRPINPEVWPAYAKRFEALMGSQVRSESLSLD